MQQARSPPPPYSGYHAIERTPLLNDPDSTSGHHGHTHRYSDEHDTKGRSRTPLITIITWLFTILALATLSGFLGITIDHARDSSARDQIRRDWDFEQQQHVHEVQRWIEDQTERQANETKRIEKFRRDWDLEQQQHVHEVQRWIEDQTERRANETKRIERFKHDEQELIKKQEQMKDDYMCEEQELIKRRDEMNREYRQREEELRRRIEGFEEELERKIEWEKRERERARVYWDDIRGAEHCLSNGRKKYSARLANVPASIDAMEACKATPVTINGIRYTTPMHCEKRGSLGGVYGHWIVENEGVCAAYWELVKQKDCTAPKSGLRRIEAKFGVVHAGEDPELLCLTTPLTINGQMYEHPMACPDWGEHGFWGIWNVPADDCQ